MSVTLGVDREEKKTLDPHVCTFQEEKTTKSQNNKKNIAQPR